MSQGRDDGGVSKSAGMVDGEWANGGGGDVGNDPYIYHSNTMSRMNVLFHCNAVLLTSGIIYP